MKESLSDEALERLTEYTEPFSSPIILSYAFKKAQEALDAALWCLNRIKEIEAERALSRFKLNDSHFMYRNKNGAYRNY